MNRRGRRATPCRGHSPQYSRVVQSSDGTLLETDPLLGIVAAACTLFCAYDNFQVAFVLDACKGYQEWVTGVTQVVICIAFVVVKIHEFPAVQWPAPPPLPSTAFILPACPANSRICRDTAVIVIISYVLLLDISLGYIWLAVFPAVAIAFIYALCTKLCPPPPAPPAAAGCSELRPNSQDNGGIDRKTRKRALKAMAAAPFFALLLMAQLEDEAANTFAVSQFLLFLSTTLGALAYMMMRLPACGVVPASELLHKAFLLLFLVTAHAMAAEALGEEAMVMACAPELLPVVIWFGLHLDGNSSIISLDQMKRPGKYVLGVLAPVAVALLAYLATSMGESGLSRCTTILVSCGVSGLLTYYLAFMLRQWPGQQTAAGKIDDVAPAPVDISLPPKKKGGKGKSAAASSSGEAAQPEEQTVAASSSEDAVRLLELWAMFLLTVAAALLILQYVVARRLGLQESQLLDTFCRNFQRLCW